MSGPVFDDEFGLCSDPCEHASVNGTECAVCGETVDVPPLGGRDMNPQQSGEHAPPRLASNRSARWAWIDRFEVPQYEGDGTYLTRWRVIQTPWFGLYVHRFTGPDPRATLHDHPWNFLSLILRGGYVERRLNPLNMQVNEAHEVRRANAVRASHAHAIVRLLRVPTWTLMLVGRRQRTWGYLDRTRHNDGHGWLWTEFDKHRHNDEFVAALARRKARLTAAYSGSDGGSDG